MRLTRFSIALLLMLLVAPLRAEVVFAFDDPFTPSEQARLKDWIDEVAGGVESLVGPFPFTVHVHFERARASEPVPWANTLRGARQGVRFHVDPRFPKEALLADWTAAHELSHLVLPSVGRKDSWFAEGFASFMQFQVMHAMGILDADEVALSYRRRLERAQRNFSLGNREFVAATKTLRARRQYKVMYWGSAVFFMRLNRELVAQGQGSLIDLVSNYLACCRRNHRGLEKLVADLDQLLDSPAIAGELAAFRDVRGFPAFSEHDLAVVGQPTLSNAAIRKADED